MEIFTLSKFWGGLQSNGGHFNPHSLPSHPLKPSLHAGICPHTLTRARCCDKHMHSSHCPCSRTYIKTTVWTSKIKLHLPVWDTLITPMSVGIQSKTKLCPTKMAPLISSPIKSISCPHAYFRPFISPVASSNRPDPGSHLRRPGVMCVCLECFTRVWSPPPIPSDYTNSTGYH